MPLTIFAALTISLLIVSAPIFLSILAPTFLSLELFGPPVPPMVLAQRMVQGINKFNLLAIPLFIFAADVISRGQIGERLVRLVESLVGHISGGMAIATIIACGLFGAISGVGAAAIVSIGPIVYPTLIRQGYSRGFAVGLILSASTLAMLIPPGVAMILYSLQTNASVGQVFLSGLSAGIILILLLALYAYVYAKRHDIGRAAREDWRERGRRTMRAFWALGLPIIIFVGIYGGYFTPTEAAAAACVYAIVVETLIYRQLKLRELFNLSAESSTVIAVLLILVAAGSTMTFYMTLQQVPQMIGSLLAEASPITILLVINVIFLIAGMLIDPNSAIIILTPLIAGVARAAGIDDVHLGAIIVMNIAIGMITPPFGLNIFIGITTFRVSYLEVVKSTLPFVCIALIGLAIVTYVPQAVLLLPGR